VETAFRCSSNSEALDEPLVGTASHVRNWLLIEHDGPWGIDAFADARGLGEVGRELHRRTHAHGVRPLLIRRLGRAAGPSPTVFAIHSGPHAPRIERLAVERFDDLLEVDLAELGRGASVGGTTEPGPLFLVCTHGRHDTCCAERGRPLAAAMDAAYPDAAWECSHIGGDRFAGNLVAFPHGLYFGRVEPEVGPQVAAGYAAGTIDLRRFRGRSCDPMVGQAAEGFLRRARGLAGIDDVRVRSLRRAGPEVTVELSTPDGHVRVRVAVEPAPERILTCRSERPLAPPRYRLLGVEPVSA
jgi:hypothetical protein